MGADKAFLRLGGSTLLERALEVAMHVRSPSTGGVGRAFEPDSMKPAVTIVGDPVKFAPFGAVLADTYPDHGPLAGIHAALCESKANLNLVLAVDLPFVDARLLSYMISRAEQSGAAVTVPLVSGRYQPLCGVYRKEFAAVAEKALAHNRNKIDALFSEVTLCTVSQDDLMQAGFSSKMFRNVNTPEEWDQVKREFEAEA